MRRQDKGELKQPVQRQNPDKLGLEYRNFLKYQNGGAE
jgi:hypothetical protein